MTALLVEDDDRRVQWFCANMQPGEVVHVRTVPEAIAALEAERFDTLWLDHDLGTEPMAGRDVALWLAAHPACNPSMFILTHTVNAVSGPKILQTLAAAGRLCVWMPFPDMLEMADHQQRAPSSDDGEPRETPLMRG